MEPLTGILIVAAVAVVVYAAAAITLTRRNKESPNGPWSRLKGLVWVAFVAAVVILLCLVVALVITVAGIADDLAARFVFILVSVIIAGAIYLFLVHPLVRVLRAQGVPGQGPKTPGGSAT